MNIPVQVAEITAYQWWGIVGVASAIIYRGYIVWKDKRKAKARAIEAKEQRAREEKEAKEQELMIMRSNITDLQRRMSALDEGDYSRVNLLHKLCKDEIKESKKAFAVAMYVKGQIEQINNKSQSK